jgi:hypothetical protein
MQDMIDAAANKATSREIADVAPLKPEITPRRSSEERLYPVKVLLSTSGTIIQPNDLLPMTQEGLD